jgi:hypothetical protein
MKGVTLLFTHTGPAAVSAAGVPRSLLGRREEPSIMLRYGDEIAGGYKAIDGRPGVLFENLKKRAVSFRFS